MEQKKINLLLICASAFFALLAIVLLVVGIAYDRGTFTKIMMILGSLVVLAFAAEIAYLFVLSRKVKPNYFLFNSDFNYNMSVEKLTFEKIDGRMKKYMSGFAPSEGKLWTGRILDDPAVKSKVTPEFHTLLSYKLLYDLAQIDSEAGWKCFAAASDSTVSYIASGVAKNGDSDMAKTLVSLKSSKPTDLRITRDFLVGNKKYIKKKIVKFVKNNINTF